MAFEREIGLGVAAVLVAASPQARRAARRGADLGATAATTASHVVVGVGKGAVEGARAGFAGEKPRPSSRQGARRRKKTT
jgi:hypothetical protein